MATSAMPTRDDFAAMLNESLGGENEGFEGRVVKGIVTAIENDLAVIDVGLKSEGRVALREFASPGQKADIKVGDEVEVFFDPRNPDGARLDHPSADGRVLRTVGWVLTGVGAGAGIVQIIALIAE